MKRSYQQARRRAAEGVTYKHDLGQHFLYDEALLRSLVEATGVGPMDGVLEIGPGAGTLTRCLCEAAGRVAAVEVDRDVLPFLRAATDAFDNLSITEGDVRRLDLAEVCRPLGEGFFVIANIPYNITTPILELLWDGGLPIRQISVMVQKEVADKLLAGAFHARLQPDQRALSVPDHSAAGTGGACGMLYAAAQGGQRLCAHGYARAAPCACGGRGAFVAYGESGFCMRRKTLINALKGVVEGEAVRAALSALGLPETVRGEALAVETWIALANACARE